MGWTSTYADGRPGHHFVIEEIEWGGTHKVLARSGRYYAVENLQTGEVFGLVALIERRGEEVAWKLIDETMGPSEDNCPASILNKLTEPTRGHYADEWRARCRANLEAKKAQPKLNKGDVVEVNRPMEFSNGAKVTRFRYLGRFDAQAMGGWGFRMRLPKNWKDRYGGYRVIERA